MGFERFSGAGGLGVPALPRTLTVCREAQLPCAAQRYQVKINGRPLGDVPSGGCVRSAVSGDTAPVEIIRTSAGPEIRVRLLLRLGKSPRVSFRVSGEGTLSFSLRDAELVRQDGRLGPDGISGK